LSEPLWSLLAVVCRDARLLHDAILREHGLHAGQQFVLRRLWQEDGLSVTQLRDRLGVEMPTVTRALQRMERRGLVQRRPDTTDERSVRIYLTEAARQLADVIPAALERADHVALQGFSEEERATLLHLLRRMDENLTAAAGEEEDEEGA
jgi:MarR family transcriptional regulator, organic hydroperoxide resistance regulator